MSPTNNSENEKGAQNLTAPSTHPGAPSNRSRRRLAQAGLTTPVIMTLFSRPVWGQVACGSLTGSKIESKGIDCFIGCTPGFWRNHAEFWVRATGIMPDTLFGDSEFGGDANCLNNDPFPNSTLLQVVSGRGSLNGTLISDCAFGSNTRPCEGALRLLGFHAVAAWLTALTVEKNLVGLPTPVSFPIASGDVVSLTCAAIASRSRSVWVNQAKEFATANEIGCEQLELALGLNPFN